jgi:putative ABC transport system substrate-binding protein
MERQTLEESMKRRFFGLTLGALLFALSSLGQMVFVANNPAEVQPTKKMPRIGYLSPLSGPPPTLVAFKEKLGELGWVEGKQIEIEYRYAGGKLHKLSEFATELVRLKVDVIVAGPASGAPNAAKRATTTIPIVMVAVTDPVYSGLVASLARPGANVTGLTFEVTREQAGKNLELLKEAVPKISRVAILRNPNVSTHIPYSKEAERVSKTLGVAIQFAEMKANNDKDLEDALGAVVNERANALLVTPSSFFTDRRQQIINFAARNKLPAIHFAGVFVNDGGLMSYGPSGQDMWRRAAIYVDKILKGTKPADLPVEQPMKFELLINLKAAKQIGLTIPPNVLARADRVIR